MGKKKTKKNRGSKTHGKGTMKAGRGKGLRGGRGKTGLGKHKRMTMLKQNRKYFGSHGFKRPQKVVDEDTTINVGRLGEVFPEKKEIDLYEVGVDKLLGAGSVEKPWKIKVQKASSRAVEKIRKNGGEVILPKEEKGEEE